MTQGVPIGSLRSLADLVSPPIVRQILDHYLAKKGGKIVTFTIDMAERLYAIARTYVKAPEEHLRRLERFCLKLRRERRHGLTEKNMAVIRAFKDPQNHTRLRALPGQLFDEALAERDALVQAAVTAEIGLAIQIELVAPMRLANLSALHLEKNVIRVAFILEKDPANYEFVRRILGHKNLQTTINFYVGLETVDAVRKFSAMALEGVDWKPKP